jgi:hypothetical protein
VEKENKYYTPGIEEFCVGFEYEQLIQGEDCFKGFEPRVFTLEMFKGFAENYKDIFYQNLIRVKYLDFQDIIDCGFVGVKTYSDELLFQRNISAFEFIELTLHLDEDYNITIEKYCQSKLITTVLEVTPDNYENYIIFRGTIKNKHELQTILKMIGVL